MKFCLVVEDSEVIRKVARNILEGMGLIVFDVETGEAAIDRCRSAMPDLILVDSHLPDMSGLDVLERLREMTAEVLPQILYCTTEADPQAMANIYRAGAADYILKPYERMTLEPKIQDLKKLQDGLAA